MKVPSYTTYKSCRNAKLLVQCVMKLVYQGQPHQVGRYDSGPAGHRQQPEDGGSLWQYNSSGGSQLGKACPNFFFLIKTGSKLCYLVKCLLYILKTGILLVYQRNTAFRREQTKEKKKSFKNVSCLAKTRLLQKSCTNWLNKLSVRPSLSFQKRQAFLASTMQVQDNPLKCSHFWGLC